MRKARLASLCGVLVACIGLGACGTAPTEQTPIEWRGRPVEEAVDLLGPPAEVVEGDGTAVHRWKVERLRLEPGRSLSGPSGVAVGTVGAVKVGEKK